MSYPITHMVAPKENVVACNECHTCNGQPHGEPGRLLHAPRRDKFQLLDSLGWILVLGHLLGVGIHGLTRMFTNGRKEGK
jgi:hypothetical protein